MIAARSRWLGVILGWALTGHHQGGFGHVGHHGDQFQVRSAGERKHSVQLPADQQLGVDRCDLCQDRLDLGGLVDPAADQLDQRGRHIQQPAAATRSAGCQIGIGAVQLTLGASAALLAAASPLVDQRAAQQRLDIRQASGQPPAPCPQLPHAELGEVPVLVCHMYTRSRRRDGCKPTLLDRAHQRRQRDQARSSQPLRSWGSAPVGPGHRQRHPTAGPALADIDQPGGGPPPLQQHGHTLPGQRVERVGDDQEVRRGTGRRGSMPRPWRSQGSGPGRPAGGRPQAGAAGGGDLPYRLRRLPGGAVGDRRGRQVPAALLGNRLVLDLDVQAFFDSCPHDLIVKAVAANTDQPWVVLYVKRWLAAPMQHPDGTRKARARGTPQGSAVSPVLANLFLHYAFDTWMARRFPSIRFERYVDDVVVHCRSQRQARMLQTAVGQRLAEVGLRLHLTKTKIVYCKDSNRREDHQAISFTFLGYMFGPRKARNRQGTTFTGFLPAMSRDKLVDKGREVRGWRLHRRTNDTLEDLAAAITPIVRGSMNSWRHFSRTQMIPLLKRINTYLMRWARKKYKRLWAFKRLKAWWQQVVQRTPDLFAHWQWTTDFLPTGW